jgi:2-dehydropantoate 2-reductase
MSAPPRIGVIGAGAIGAYGGAHLARAGPDVVLVDAWAENVEEIRSRGVIVSGAAGSYTVPVSALHLHEAQRLAAAPLDIAFVCVKLYDTAWATQLVMPYLAPRGYVVTLQNGVIEDLVASICGWGRTVGCIASTMSVDLVAPGHVRRARRPGGSEYCVFRAGEVHGRITPRLRELVALLGKVDSAEATSNLWGERWAKLVANTMTTGVSAASGLPMHEILSRPALHPLLIALAAEAIAVGRGLGYAIEPVRGLDPDIWAAADGEDADALRAVDRALAAECARIVLDASSGTAQDIRKGRKTEIDYMNGYVAAQGRALAIATPHHDRVCNTVRGLETGAFRPSPDLLLDLSRQLKERRGS